MQEVLSVGSASGRAQVTQALQLALHYHAGQTRKDGATPYLIHPLRVGLLLLQAGASLDVVCAGLTHDLIEDTKASWDTLAQGLGADVADLVAAVSEDKRRPQAERKAEYFQHLTSQPAEIQMIKLADWLDNVQDLVHATWTPTQQQTYLRRAEKIWEQTNGQHETLRTLLREALDEQWNRVAPDVPA